MDLAQTSEGSYIRASDIATLGSVHARKNLYCPHCKQAVFFKMGPHTRPHFAHFNQSADHIGKGESDLHQQAKIAIAHQLELAGIPCHIEYSIEDKMRRADIFINQQTGIHQHLTIEIQYSPLSAQSVYAREADYAKHGIAVVWLLGYQSDYASIFKNSKGVHPKSSVINRLRPFIIHMPAFGFCLPFWYEDEEKVLLLNLDIYGKPMRKIIMKIAKYLYYFCVQPAPEKVAYLAIQIETISKPIKQNRFIQTLLVSPNQFEKRILDFLYVRGRYIQHINPKIFNYRGQTVFTKHVDWHLLVIYQVLTDQGMPLSDILAYMYEHDCFYEHPPFTKDLIEQYIRALIRHFKMS